MPFGHVILCPHPTWVDGINRELQFTLFWWEIGFVRFINNSILVGKRFAIGVFILKDRTQVT